MFKDYKPGYILYILDKDAMTSSEGKVVGVGNPYMEPQKPGQISPSINCLVDITVETSGRTMTLAMPESSDIAFAGNLVISSDKSGILREVQAMRAQSENVVNSIDKHKKIIEGCDAIIADLDTDYKEKQETNKRISKLENTMNDVSKMMKELLEKLN